MEITAILEENVEYEKELYLANNTEDDCWDLSSVYSEELKK